MRFLILGGTAWLSREIAVQALEDGHDVVCAARGESGPAPDGAEWVHVDRDRPDALRDLAETGQEWDSVIDVTRRPSHSRAAVEALGDVAEHWVYVSTISVYADHSVQHQDVHAATVVPATADVDELDTSRYGELKRACEVAVTDALPDRALVVRPGLVVGPGDPTGRFTYWPHHASTAPALLAPESPDDDVQLIDVRDLAGWLLRLAEGEVVGTLDGAGPPMPREQFVQEVCAGVEAEPELVWVSEEFLAAHDVRPWMGERSIPLWAPGSEHAGLMSRDVLLSVDAGLRVRSLVETARDTAAWLRATADAPVTGLTDEQHAALIQAAMTGSERP